MRFKNFDIPAFLQEYWQKKPLLIRSPWDAWSNPLEPNELAGLADEDHVESRLVTQRNQRWELEQGPFPEGRFGKLERIPWTLLVQGVDHHVPSVAALLEPFRFVPNWRVDDVMVSYAVDGGGVGPHFDHYDVFLLQGLGRRRWELGELCDETTELLPHDDLRLLADFRAVEEWILEPGDMLYVPPRVAHRGVAIGDDCMTYSIGFRAPSRAELLTNWAESVSTDLSDGDRYADPDLAEQRNPGEISSSAIRSLQAMISETMLDRSAFERWFGQYSTMPKDPDIDWRPEETISSEVVLQCLAESIPLVRNPASRFSFIREQTTSLLLFIDGRCYPCRDEVTAFAEQICASVQFTFDAQSSLSIIELIVELVNQGSLAFLDQEE
ncbi:MAG: cupin domain-containing protein [Erythrobacter sp.]|nr:MAG: cupin domain-containing protein [Erythrobacter sp.]